MYQVSTSWLYGSVRPYFEKRGIKLLKDDMLFIEKCLSKIPPERHRKVIRGYFEVWNAKIATNVAGETVAVNTRYEANCYLRDAADAAN